MSIYLDTSFFVPLFVREQASPTARAVMARTPKPLIVSSWTLTEFASALASKVRLGALTARQRAIAQDRARDALQGGLFAEEAVLHMDFAAAAQLLTPDQPPLRAGDAMHIAVCRRLNLDLATFDGAMAEAAKSFGIDLTV